VTKLIFLTREREKAEETKHGDLEIGEKTGQMAGRKTKKFVRGR
jgi:hypothetical protein